jgi:DNA-directed RNA polymerase specialized sigma24 family protein
VVRDVPRRHARLPSLPADANVQAWLVRIAQRTSIDVLRARSRRAMPVGELPDAVPHDERQAVLYHHLARLPYAQIAELLGGSTEAAKRAAAAGILDVAHRTVDTPVGELLLAATGVGLVRVA